MTVNRAAALYDIHANLPALDAVLAEIDGIGVDLILLGGDVLSGPMPDATLARIQALRHPVRMIRGNGERELAAPPPGDDVWEIGTRWAASRLPADIIASMAALPDQTVLDIGGLGPVRACHGSPRRDDEPVTLVTTDARLESILAGVAEGTILCGHTHSQFDRTVGRHRVVNAGSVGMPYERRPGAYWALLGPTIELRRTPYDLQAAADLISATEWPDATAFATGNILTVPDPFDAAAMFEAAVSH